MPKLSLGCYNCCYRIFYTNRNDIPIKVLVCLFSSFYTYLATFKKKISIFKTKLYRKAQINLRKDILPPDFRANMNVKNQLLRQLTQEEQIPTLRLPILNILKSRQIIRNAKRSLSCFIAKDGRNHTLLLPIAHWVFLQP